MKFPIRIAKLCSISLLIILLIASLGTNKLWVLTYEEDGKQVKKIYSWNSHDITYKSELNSWTDAKKVSETQKTALKRLIKAGKTFLGFGIFCLFLLLLVIGIDFSYFCLGKKLDSLVMNNASAILVLMCCVTVVNFGTVIAGGRYYFLNAHAKQDRDARKMKWNIGHSTIIMICAWILSFPAIALSLHIVEEKLNKWMKLETANEKENEIDVEAVSEKQLDFEENSNSENLVIQEVETPQGDIQVLNDEEVAYEMKTPQGDAVVNEE
jgi:hypothetical protein